MLASSEKPCGKLGFIIWKHIHFSVWLEKKWMVGKYQYGLGCGLDVIGCGTGIVVRNNRSSSHSILKGRLGSGIDDM